MNLLVSTERELAGIGRGLIIGYQQVERWLWQWCLAAETLPRLCVLLALALIVSLVVPQSPTSVHWDAAGMARWLATIPAPFQTWSSLFNGLGLFRVWVTPWFLFLLACVALVSLVSLGNQISWFLRPFPVRQDALEHAGDAMVIYSPQPFEAVVRAVRDMMDRFGASLQDVQGQQAWVYGVRHRLVRLFQSWFFLGVLLVVCGLVINARWGWSQQDIQALPGQVVSAGPGGTLQLELVGFDPEKGKATIRPAGQPDITVRQRSSTCVRDTCYRLAEQTWPLVRIEARDDGQVSRLYADTAYSEPAGALVFPFSPLAQSEGGERLFIAPDHQVYGQLQWQNKGDVDGQPPAFVFTVFDQTSQVLAQRHITAQERAATIDVGHIRFGLEVSSYAALYVSAYPGLAVIVAGLVCLLVSGVATMLPWQQIWASVTAEPGRVVTRLWARSYGWSRTWKRPYLAAVSDLCAQIQAPDTRGIEA